MSGLPASDHDSVLNEQISEVIKRAGLRRPENAFFRGARHAGEVSPAAALAVAVQWGVITKAFMFTTISSIGVKALDCHEQAVPDRVMLGALQTAFCVIGDDFANLAPQFSEVAPAGAPGMHYLWWEDTIVAPLAALGGPEALAQARDLPDGVRALLGNMTRLATVPLGAAVQLRVVEDIALDIAVAFRRLYARVEADGVAPFAAPGALDWVDSHIKAETVHAASVSDDETGMTVLAVTDTERETVLSLSTEYAASWAGALSDFAMALGWVPALAATS